jgi:hypothetical protein
MEEKQDAIQQQLQALDDRKEHYSFRFTHASLILLFCTTRIAKNESLMHLFLYIVEQCPWSEWRRTAHGAEQVQQLYSMCEQARGAPRGPELGGRKSLAINFFLKGRGGSVMFSSK